MSDKNVILDGEGDDTYIDDINIYGDPKHESQSQDQKQGEAQGQLQGQAELQGQLQGQGQGQASLQGQGQAQLQGQAAVQLVGQGAWQDSKNHNDNKNDNSIGNHVDSKTDSSVDNKVSNHVDNKVNVDVSVHVGVDVKSDPEDNDWLDIDTINMDKGQLLINPDSVWQNVKGEGNDVAFNVDQINMLLDNDKNEGNLGNTFTATTTGGGPDEGSEFTIKAEATGGHAKVDDIDVKLDDGTVGDISGASADAAASIKVNTIDLVMGANIQFNSIDAQFIGNDGYNSADSFTKDLSTNYDNSVTNNNYDDGV